jgi:deaminated glutathione amidase
MALLKVATCQFPVGADIDVNLAYVKRQMIQAAGHGARVAHFPEGALSGYAGVDFESFAGYRWDQLRGALGEVARHAARLGIWAVVGSAHRLSGTHKPHNSVYVIDDGGDVVDRYDKRFCSGDADEKTGDLAHYSPGDHFSVWDIDGVRCGALVCYDYRFPELYRQYKKLGTELVFHSFHAGNMSPQRLAEIEKRIGPELRMLNPAPSHTYPGITMPAAMTAAAASNHIWISCPNTCAPQSCWPAFLVRADGITIGRLRRNIAGVLVSTVDTEADLYDSTAVWRDRAIAGTLHSGTVGADRRSRDRTCF